MDEYIELKTVLEHAEYDNNYRLIIPVEAIKAVPAADVAPVVHGRWVPTESPFMNECEDCSVCGYRTVWGHRYNYCPNCGARMDGGAK